MVLKIKIRIIINFFREHKWTACEWRVRPRHQKMVLPAHQRVYKTNYPLREKEVLHQEVILGMRDNSYSKISVPWNVDQSNRNVQLINEPNILGIIELWGRLLQTIFIFWSKVFQWASPTVLTISFIWWGQLQRKRLL